MRNSPQQPTVGQLLLRPINIAVLVVGLGAGILLAGLTQQPHLIASAQEPASYCGDGTCDPDEDWSWCGDCVSSCGWCTDGTGEGQCPDYSPYDAWIFVSGVQSCSTSGCCIGIDPPDDSPPVTNALLDGTLGQNSWYVTPVTVTLSATDDLSGVAQTYLDDMGYSGPVTYTAEGETTITWQSVDNVGNVEGLNSLTFYIDTVPPASAFTAPPASGLWYSGVLTLTGASVDETSGVAGVEISLDYGATWQPASGETEWAYIWDTHTASEQMHNVQVRGTDQAGNVETPVSIDIGIDNSGPFFEVGPFPGEYCFNCSGPLTFTLTAFDEQSKINNSAIVIKQNGKDVRVLQAPGGELRNTPVVWDGKDAEGQMVPPGDYQLLFYTANYAGMFGSFGAGIRVVDALPAVPPEAAPVVPVEPPVHTPWIMTPIPPTPIPFLPPSGVTSGQVSIVPQQASAPGASTGNLAALLTGATGGVLPGQTSAAGPGIAALLAAMAAYVAAQQTAKAIKTGTGDPPPPPMPPPTPPPQGGEDNEEDDDQTPSATVTPAATATPGATQVVTPPIISTVTPTPPAGSGSQEPGAPIQIDPNLIEHLFSDPSGVAETLEAVRNASLSSRLLPLLLSRATVENGIATWPPAPLYQWNPLLVGDPKPPMATSSWDTGNPSLNGSNPGAATVGAGGLAAVSLATGLLDLLIPGENPALLTISDATHQGGNLAGLAKLPTLLANPAALKQAATIAPGVGSFLGQLASVAYGGYEFGQSWWAIDQQNKGLRPWNEQERWGEFLQMVGGGALATTGIFGAIAALGVAAFALPALPFVAIAGCALIAGGWVVNNWDKFEAGAAGWRGIDEGLRSLEKAIWKDPKKTVLDPFNYWIGRPVLNTMNTVKTAVNNAVNTVKTTANNVVNTVKTTVNNVVNTVKTKVNNAVNNAVNTVKTKVNNAVNTVKTTVNNVGNYVKNNVVKPVQTFVKTVTKPVQTFVKTVAKPVQTFVKTVAKPVQTFVKTVAKPVQTFVKTVTKPVQTFVKAVTKPVQTVAKSVGNFVKGLFGGRG